MKANKQKISEVNERAEIFRQTILIHGMNVSKLGTIIGSNEAYFRNSTGTRPSPIFTKRIKALFPNLNLQWLLSGEGEMLTSGDTTIAPLDLLRIPAIKLKTVMRAAYGPDKELAEKLLLENDINPDDLYNRYPEIFPILAPEDSPSHAFNDIEEPEYEALPSVSTDERDITIAKLQTEINFLREQLSHRDATIAHFLDLSMKYIESHESNK